MRGIVMRGIVMRGIVMKPSNPRAAGRRFLGRRFLVGTVAVGAMLVGGCRRSGPDVQFVEGVVTLDGAPLAGADVGFSPVQGGMPSFGRTDARGVFHLSTVRGGARGQGAVVGDYAVTVSKWRNRLDALGPRPDPADAAASAAWSRQEEEIAKLPPDYIVPKAYGDKATSGLKATVKPGRNVGPEFRFELKGDATSN